MTDVRDQAAVVSAALQAWSEGRLEPQFAAFLALAMEAVADEIKYGRANAAAPESIRVLRREVMR